MIRAASLLVAATLFLIASGCAEKRSARCDALLSVFDESRARGDAKVAIQEADEGMRVCAGMRDESWYWAFYIKKAELLNSLGDYDRAVIMLARELPRDPSYATLRCTRRIEQAWVASRRGDYPTAEKRLDEAEAEARGAGSNGPELLHNLAIRKTSLYGEEKKFDAARRMIEGLNLAGGGIERGQILFAYGFVLIQNARYEEAARYFEEALPSYRKAGNAIRLARIYNNLGASYYHLGDLERALDYLLKAEPVLQNGSDLTVWRTCLTTIGLIYLERNEYEKATAFLNRALEVSQKLHEEKSEAEVLNNLASVAIRAEEWGKAETYNGRALKIKRRHKDSEAELYSLVNEAQIQAGQDNFQGALATLDALASRSYIDPRLRIDAEQEYIAIYRQLRDEPKARAHYRTALALSERVRSEMQKDENKLAWYDSQNSLNQEWVRVLIELDHPAEALDAAESSRIRLMLDRLGKPGVLSNRGSKQYQRIARSHHAVLISYWLMPDASYAWIVKPDKLEVRKLPGEQAIASLVAAYQGFLEDQGDPLHSNNASGERLRKAILDPILPDLAEAKNVILVPDGPLHALNFETLPVRGRYWIEDMTLTVAPSLNLLAPAGPPPPASQSAVLLIGDAKPTSEFPPLPSASREIQTIASLFSRNTVLRGAAATPAAYLGAPDSQSYIHFAAHASANAERPLDSAVILSPSGKDDGRLTARDLLNKPIHAELVTISACRSAGVRSYHGEGLVGFAWAFLQTGAHGVIAGLWDASDEATARIMGNLYSGIAKDQPPATALRQAKLALIHSDSHYARPYYWASFQYYLGAGR